MYLREVLISPVGCLAPEQVVVLRQQIGAWPPPSGSWTWEVDGVGPSRMRHSHEERGSLAVQERTDGFQATRGRVV